MLPKSETNTTASIFMHKLWLDFYQHCHTYSDANYATGSNT